MPPSPSATNHASLNDQLSSRTSIFGLRLWVVLGICVGVGIVIILFLLSIWFISKRNNQNRTSRKTQVTNIVTHVIPASAGKPSSFPSSNPAAGIPVVSREITEIRLEAPTPLPVGTHLKPPSEPADGSNRSLVVGDPVEEASPTGHQQRIHIEIGKDHRIAYPEETGNGQGTGGRDAGLEEEAGTGLASEVSQFGWGQWYSLRELEESTNGFAEENVIGEGGYGIVYRGVLEDNTLVAVKNLLNNKGQAEKEFRVEVEAIGRVRHKNLVRLLGYCAEATHSMLVYEYVDNGNLEQWLHGEIGLHSPLTWEIRMNIVTGTAKGLTYLHEGLEPKVVHRDIKSSNILLDKQWDPKVSDFGLAKLLGSERNYVTTRVMGTFGYVAPEYASTGMLNERSDVYSFGILLMEIISGRSPVDYSRPPGEVNLVDWVKMMISRRNAESILDPKLTEKPSSRALKRALLVALRCVDPNAQKRPKIGHVVHMLETEEFPSRDDHRLVRVHGHLVPENIKERLTEKPFVPESGNSSGYESGAPSYPAHSLRWKNQEATI